MTPNLRKKIQSIATLVVVLTLALPWSAFALTWTDPLDGAPGTLMKIFGANDADPETPDYAFGQVVRVEVTGPYAPYPAYNMDDPLSTCDENIVVGVDNTWQCDLLLWDDPALAVGEYTYTAWTYADADTAALGPDYALFHEDGAFTDSQATVTGTVTAGGAGLSGATVTCTSGCNNVVSTTTGTSGTYSLGVQFPNGNTCVDITLTAAKTGYVSQSQSVYVCHTQTTSGITFDLSPACTGPSVTTSPAPATVTYGANAQFTAAGVGSLQWQVLTTESGAAWTDISGATSSPLTVSSPTVAMSGYQYRAVFSACGTTATSNAATLTVNPAPVTITAGSYSAAYDGAAHAPSACAVTGTYKGALTCTNDPDSVGPNVGSGTVTPVLALNGETESNFSVTPVNGSWSIGQASSTVTVSCPASVAYNGSPQEPCTAQATGVGMSPVALTVTYSADHTNVGTVTASASWAGDTNHTGSSGSATFEITKAPVTITAGSYNGVYDGVAHAPSACVVSGLYTGALTCTNDPTSVGPNVGSGTIAPVLVLNGETASNFDVTKVNGAWSITKAPVTITAGSYNATYDGVAHAPSACVVSGAYTGALTCTNNPLTVGPDVGSGTIAPVLVLNGETASNFDVTSVNGAWSITKAPVTITAGSYIGVYDGVAHAPSACVVSGAYKGALTCTNNPLTVGPDVGSGTIAPLLVLNGETASNFDVTSVNGAWEITKAPVTITAGSYNGVYDGVAHAPSACVVSGAYTGALTCTNDPLTVGPNVGSGTIAPVLVLNGETASNFDVTSVNGAWSISKAILYVTASSHNIIYGDPVPTITPSYVGFVGGDDADDLDTAPTCSTTYQQFDDVGTYASSCSGGSDNNYAFDYTAGTVTVSRKTLYVTASSHNIIYGDPAPTITPSYDGFVGGDDASDLDTAPTCSTTYEQFDDVGAYFSICSGGVDNNYAFGYIPGKVTVAPKTATVTADNKSKIFGEDNPMLTATVVGEVAGGDPINYTLSTTAETCSNVGTYPISVNLGANPNYDITTYGATLTVNQKDASVTADNKSKIFGEANPALTAAVVGEVCGVSLNYSLSTTAETCSNVGDYDIAVNLGANPNYNVTTTDATLTIGKKAASVTANNLTKSYGDPNPPLTATVVGEVCSDLIDYSLSTTAETLSPVGTYPIVVTLGSNPNYTVTKKDGTLTILPRAATPTYTSFGWYSTKSPTDKTFSVLLSATVVATGGDIRTATVKFMEGSTTLCTGAVGLVTEGDLTTGVASCYWNGSLKDISTAEMHEVTVVVGGNYTGATDPTPVTISPAGIANFITGGGYLLLTNSGGTTPGEYGSKLNFGFTVKYNKSGTNPQGKITTILRAADGKHYQIKSTSIDSLVVKPVNLTKKTTGTGLFTAKCVLKDLSTGLDVPGQYTMKLYMEDNGEPGGAKWGDDQLYLVIFNSAGGIWFSSNWTGTTTALQNIQNGNLQVH